MPQARAGRAIKTVSILLDRLVCRTEADSVQRSPKTKNIIVQKKKSTRITNSNTKALTSVQARYPPGSARQATPGAP